MQTAQVSHHHAARHDVVEVRDHEVGVGQMDVHAERGKKQSRQTADGEQANKSKCI